MAGEDMETGEKRTNRSYSWRSYDDLEPQLWRSWLVPIFILVNVVMFITVMFVNDCPNRNPNCVARFLGRFSFESLRQNPLFGPSSSTLLKMGGLDGRKVVEKHQIWRLFTCLWLHAGLIHLLLNTLCLVFVGIRLEQQFGFVRVGVLYLFSGLSGTLLSSLFIRTNISVGASAALFGFLGAMLSELFTNWTIYSNKVAAVLTLMTIMAINFGVGMLPHVDNMAHIGGLWTGFLLGFVLLPRPQFRWLEQRSSSAEIPLMSKYKTYQYVLWLISLVLLFVGFVVGLVMLFRGENGKNYCRWCHYLSCVPTSRWNCD